MALLTASDAKNVAKACKAILLGNRITSINNIELKKSQVIIAAVDVKIMTKYQADSIQARPQANKELVSGFLDCMDCRPPLDFLKFIDILRKENQEGAIDSILEEACNNGRHLQDINTLMYGKDPSPDPIESMKETLFAAFQFLTEKKTLPADDMGKLRNLRTPEPGTPMTPFNPYGGFPAKLEQPYVYGMADQMQNYIIPYQNVQGTPQAYPFNQITPTQAQLYPRTPALSMQPQYGNPLPTLAVTPLQFKNISLQSQVWGGQNKQSLPQQSVSGLPQPTPPVPYQGHNPSPQKPILASLPQAASLAQANIVSPSTVQRGIPNMPNCQSPVYPLGTPSSGMNVNEHNQTGPINSKQISMAQTSGVTQPVATTPHPSIQTSPHEQVFMNDMRFQAFSPQSSPGGQHLQHALNMPGEGQSGNSQMQPVTPVAQAAQPISIQDQVMGGSDLTMTPKLGFQAEIGLPVAKFPSAVTGLQTQSSDPAGTLPAADQVLQGMTDSSGQPIATSISTQQMLQPNEPASVFGPVAASVVSSPADPSSTVSQTFTTSSQNLPANADPTNALFSPPQVPTQGQPQQLSQEPNFSPNLASVQLMEVENRTTVKRKPSKLQQQYQNLTSNLEHGSQAAAVTRSNSDPDLLESPGQGQMSGKMSSTVRNESRYTPYSLGNRGNHPWSAHQSPAFLNRTVRDGGSQSAGVQISYSEVPVIQQQHLQSNSMPQIIQANMPSNPVQCPPSVINTNFVNQQNGTQTTQQPTFNITEVLPSMSMQSVSPQLQNTLNTGVNGVINPSSQQLPGIDPVMQPGHAEGVCFSPDSSGLALSDCFEFSSLEVMSSSSEFYLQQKAEAYPMSKRCRGPVLIINNKHFFGAERPRVGTDVDCAALEKLFSNLHFQCLTYTDLTAKEIIDAVRQLVNWVQEMKAQACGLFILSHGKKNHILGSDGDFVHRADICKQFTNAYCPNVVKFLFFQACRGDNFDKVGNISPNIAESDVDLDFQQNGKPQTDPSMSDYVIGYPTLGSYRSFRDEEGSWWIQAMIKVFSKYAAKNHILELLTKVNNLVSNSPGFTRGPDDRIVQVVQMPESKSTLRKNLYFFPGIVPE